MPPTMLMNSLESIRRRVRTLSVVFGIGIVAAATVALVLLLVLLDYTLNLPPAPRVFMLVAALVVLGYAVFRWIVKPLLAKLSLTDVASRLEAAFPQFDDRLRSTVDFLGGKVPGSEMMKARVVDETTRLAGGLDLNAAVVTKPVWYSAIGGIGAVIALMLLTFAVTPQFRDIALSRLFSPFGGAAWPKRVQIALLGDVPKRVPVGQHVDLRMILSRGDRDSAKAIVYYQYGEMRNGEFVGGPVQQEYMSRGVDKTFGSSLDTRVEAGASSSMMRIWIKSGDDELRVSDVTIVPRLTIKSVTATVTPPAYVGGDAKPLTFDLGKGGAVMPIGAKVALDVTFNKALSGKPEEVTIEPAEASMSAPKFESSTAIDGGVSHTWTARESLRFHIRATDTDGIRNSGLEEFEMIVRPDQNPSVQIESPRRNEERTAVSTIPLQGLAEDDYGIQSLKLVIDRLGDKKHWEISLVESTKPTSSQVSWTRRDSSGDRLRFSVSYNWGLAQLKDANLKPGDVLEYFLLVQDNFNLENQTHPPVPSGRLRISIISQEDLTSKIIEDLRQVKTHIGEVKTNQDRTRTETQSLADETKDKPQMDAADRQAADRLSNQQATAATQSKQLAGKLDEVQNRLNENKSTAQELKDLARDVKNDLNQSAEKEMKDAAAQIGQANQQNTPQQQRNEQLNKAQENQKQASARLQQALDRMENIGTLAQTIDRIGELLRQQKEISKNTADVGKQNLGKKPEEMKPDDRDKLNKASDAQAKLAEKTQQAMASMNKTAEQLEKADPQAAKAMKDAAQTGQQQQVQQNQQKASNQARQNQQAQAQAAQKQAELGLQMMLNQLKEAEKRKLAELSKQLAQMQEQIENLIRRQAGHNLDNLALQGEKLTKLDADQRKELFEIAARDEKTPLNAQLPTLSSGQELTERNARDIGKSADAVPNASEVAAQIIRAADKMERAIVYLRQTKLPDAYEPPQVEALAALLDAHKKVDAMKKNVDEQINKNQKEALRQQYVKIKEDQDKLNGDTTKIETARQPDGTLPRLDAVRLGQLPGEQGKLADRVGKLEEDLTDADSVIYLWANKDIADSMKAVKDDLGKQETDVATQTEQKRIAQQLQAMIDNLVEHRDNSKFAQDSSGNDGGQGKGQSGGKKRLPSEAELRLTQALQKAINTATKVLGEQKEKDKPKLLALGNRQGSLRGVLGQLLEKSSQGEMKFGPEPDNRDQLPEEANVEQVENQELENQLLNDTQMDEKNEKKVNLVGDRMARVRQRLALNDDPGKTTQIIEDRIVTDLDILIDQARRQQAQTRNTPPKPGQQQPQPQPKPSDAQAQNQGQQQQNNQANNPAQQSTLKPGQDGAADTTNSIRESMQEWGGVTPRQRAAVIEGGGETIIEPYKKLIDDYYKSLATKATER